MLQDKIKEIIKISVWAPSGENCQPWRFELSGNRLDIFNLPERDQSLYSWGQRASYVAHGALIENIVIASKSHELATQISLFPDPSDENMVATIIFSESNQEKDDLSDFIKSRVSNRKPYKKDALNDSEKTKLLASNQFPNSVALEFVDDIAAKKRLGYIAALNEKVIFENFSQHQFFFNHINWTKKEDDVKSIGFFIETLELPPPAKFMFKLIRHWGIMKIMNGLKFGNLVAAGNGKVNSACSAFGAIKIRTLNKEDFLEAGRVLQRVWLTATNLDLHMQPLTGIIFLRLMIFSGLDKAFHSEHINLINEAYQDISRYFNTKPNEFVIFMFRIGKGDVPTAHSSRLAPIIKETN